MTVAQTTSSLAIVVLISGNGSNLQAIIDAINSGELPAVIRAVISNRPHAFGLERARRAGIATVVIDNKLYTDRKSFDGALQTAIDNYRPALVVLAGFMRILGQSFVRHYQGRLVNVHPSLLPAFRGLDTHRRALAAGVTVHGLSIHFVTDELDGGPIIIQKKVPVLDGDDVETLAARVLKAEHRLYPKVIRWYAEERLKLKDHQIIFDGKPLDSPLYEDAI